MKRDLFQQSAYERSKAMWAQAVREGKQHEFYHTPEARIFGSEWTANMHEDILCVDLANLFDLHDTQLCTQFSPIL